MRSNQIVMKEIDMGYLGLTTAKRVRAMSHAFVVLSTTLLTACAGLPQSEYQSPTKTVASYASSTSFTAPANAWPLDSWWKNYGDLQLDALIDEALEDSPTLAAADARMRRASAFADNARAARLPQLSLNSSATEQKQSYNYLSPASMTPQGWNDYGRSTLDLSWELDFWGKNRRALAAATSDANAAQADAAQARLTLVTAIASSYAELARQYAALDTAVAAREVRTKTAELFKQRRDHGLETLGSVRQVEARRASAEADVLAIDEQISLQRNRIAALLGAGPDRGLTVARPTLNLNRSFGLPSELAANLIGRRPDLTAARLRAEAASERIGQAKAAFYPNVNLSAFIGVHALGIDLLSKNGSSIGSIGPAVSLPIFTGGKLRAQLRSADAEYAEAVANYERTIVQSLQEVADAAVSQKALAPQLTSISTAVDAAREAWRVQNNRYEGGLATYLEVLSAEDYLLSNLRAQSDLQSRSFALDVALVRALGGGYANSST
jgi:NodT family efflux transporter outer membrane factor (OMF) lipoprotein